MNKIKSTKRALIMSAAAVLMSISMLIGTTYAWFTDTASTGVNKIVSGSLKVDIIGEDNEDHVEKLNFKNAAGAEGEALLWEPGCRYLTEGFRIANKGNLALKWKAQVNKGTTAANEGNFDLLDVIDFYLVTKAADGTKTETALDEFTGNLKKTETSEVYYIKGVMKTTAGNDYQGLTLDGITITVIATQDTIESDSYNNIYDENAAYPVTDAASIADAVAGLAAAGDKNVVGSVAKDISNTSGIVTANGNTLIMDFNNKTVGVSYGKGSANTTTNGMQLLQGSTVTLKNGTYKANHGEDANHNIAILIQNYSNLTIENCTLDMREANDTAGNSRGTSYALSTNCGKVVIKGNTNIYARNGEFALDVMHWETGSYKAEGTSVTFDETMTGIVNGKIDVYCYRNNRVVKPVDDSGAVLTIMGGTFVNSGLTLEQFKAFVPTGYTVTTNTDGSFTVSK